MKDNTMDVAEWKELLKDILGIEDQVVLTRGSDDGAVRRPGLLTIAAAVENIRAQKKDEKTNGGSPPSADKDSSQPSQGPRAPPSSFTEGAEEIQKIEKSEKQESDKRVEMYNNLLSELERLKKERDVLEEESKKLREALHATKDTATQPTVVFQHRELDDHWQSKLAQLSAAKTTEKMLEALHQQIASGDEVLQSHSLSSGAINERGVDLSKEKGLSEDSTLEQVQGRIRQVLVELHLRTRLEAQRLREAVKMTEDAVQSEQMQKLSLQLVAQENELQRLMEMKVEEIRRHAEEEISKIDETYDQRIREEWVQVNTQAEQLHDHALKIKEIQLALESERELEKERENLKKYFEQTSQTYVGRIKTLKETVYKFNEDYVHQLSLAADALKDAVESGRNCSKEVKFLRKLAGRQAHALAPSDCGAGGDTAVDAALSTIPIKDEMNVSTMDELQTRFFSASLEARRRLLELVGTGMSKLYDLGGSINFRHPSPTDSLPEGDDPAAVLKRAGIWVYRGRIAQAMQELEVLEGRPAQAMSGWMEEARRRLVVQQALQVLHAHISLSSTQLA
ncbi:hypothetical protein GUITHDRAFT_109126 [Guillardia theta CCMP2712]|uniref:MICOS complex subunit MIC60 n=1 Tax=Guillardia theta (strain CCMP2712) TaxID=905079 RepID=L1JAF7_GUITC|nr:hypothetical protein GUITHDRAFT_109126 [Guillardia theta CCMP2712]EKX45080.1 hypothetical protein GUITHDRAFT_109126 [Guillardia theta CCMP2712]|eukprot:XP_005832060.1 hypothetical protein GUITHDRAFT_109126 [Guillardia theta CCMP2712]